RTGRGATVCGGGALSTGDGDGASSPGASTFGSPAAISPVPGGNGGRLSAGGSAIAGGVSPSFNGGATARSAGGDSAGGTVVGGSPAISSLLRGSGNAGMPTSKGSS